MLVFGSTPPPLAVLLPFALLLLLSCLPFPASARSADEWKSRTVYQLLTDRYARDPANTARCTDADYCGGNFHFLTQKLDYIQALGCDAVWISPVVTNAPRGFHGQAHTAAKHSRATAQHDHSTH